MLRFTDPRLYGANRWIISETYKYEYISIMGAGITVYIKRTPVTNGEYKNYLSAKKYTIPNELGGEENDDLPVNYVSYKDALIYCEQLNEKDTKNLFHIRSEIEWELAAGHMPKDPDFNANNVNSGRVSVF